MIPATPLGVEGVVESLAGVVFDTGEVVYCCVAERARDMMRGVTLIVIAKIVEMGTFVVEYSRLLMGYVVVVNEGITVFCVCRHHCDAQLLLVIEHVLVL